MLKLKLVQIYALALAICALGTASVLASTDDTDRIEGFWMCVQGSDYKGKELNVRDGAVYINTLEGSAMIGRIEKKDGYDFYIRGESPYPDDRIRSMDYNWMAMGEGPDLIVCRREDWRESLY